MTSIMVWFDSDIPTKERYRLIRDIGFDGTLLWWGDSPSSAPGDYLLHPQMARNAGLYVENAHIPFKDFNGINNLWLDNLDGAALAEHLMQCIAECTEHEIPTIVMHLTQNGNLPEAGTHGPDRIRRLVDSAERLNVNIALENLKTTSDLDYVLGQIDSPRLGFCLDSGHLNCHCPGENILERFGTRLKALHLHDNDGVNDRHLLPFDGTIDWDTLMKEIAATGYNGPTALEVVRDRGYSDMPVEEFLRQAFERATCLAGIEKGQNHGV